MKKSQDGHDRVPLLRMRARLNRCVRGFFEEAGFVEVETPLLAARLIPEPSIGIFATEQHHADGSARTLYLTPSPELWMKRLVAAGMPRVYQMARCFRNVEEQGPFHHREFTMLEWYAVDEDYHAALCPHGRACWRRCAPRSRRAGAPGRRPAPRPRCAG